MVMGLRKVYYASLMKDNFYIVLIDIIYLFSSLTGGDFLSAWDFFVYKKTNENKLLVAFSRFTLGRPHYMI